MKDFTFYHIYYIDRTGMRIYMEGYPSFESVRQGIIKLIDWVLCELSAKDFDGKEVLEQLKERVERMTEAELINDGVMIPDDLDNNFFLIDQFSGQTYYIEKDEIGEN